ncbi:secreted protein containing Domain of unknown function DUF306, Meta and HslJ, partial [gut metagenome]
MNIKLLAAAPLLTMLAACSSLTAQPPQLTGRTLVWSDSPVAAVTPSITFHTNNDISGTSGCNLLTGQVQFDGTKVDFSRIGSTKRLCSPEEMSVEATFLDHLANTTDLVADG